MDRSGPPVALQLHLQRQAQARSSTSPASLPPYSSKLIDEGVFSEVQLRDADRLSVRRVMSSSCSQPSPTKELSSSMRKPSSRPSSSCSEMSALSLGKPNISPWGL